MMGTKKSNVASYISNILYSNSVRRREIDSIQENLASAMMLLFYKFGNN